MPFLSSQQRKLLFEQFEQRLVLSANALITPNEFFTTEVESGSGGLAPDTTLARAHGQTGVDHVHEDYGFDGTGQTVVVIDTGIAWDHYALGGGLGEGFRVVGGYDFAEGDYDPYDDDGEYGAHGTHVAGIIGSSDPSNLGVASGVDLIALRVFADDGSSSTSWLENALEWVHTNKDSFANPITTVNMSFGSDWNSDTVPGWARLEAELEQLYDAGIFVTSSAGNDFEDYNEPGLGYPAVSPFVVPVASHGNDLDLSYFSQRNSRVLAAPGEAIRSTVPGYSTDSETSDGFRYKSGTSMASPYVAGAGVLLRQANEFVGVEDIDQDLLYQQFLDTAATIYDEATEDYYYRLDVQAAIDSVVQDLHADDYDSATFIDSLEDGTIINGTIGKLADKDAFEFTATHSGMVTFDVEATHDLIVAFETTADDAWVYGNQVTFNVVEGQTYQFKIGTDDGIGHYQATVVFDNPPAVAGEDLGQSVYRQFASVQVEGQKWFQLDAANSGILTVVSNMQVEDNASTIRLYDSQMNIVGSGETVEGTLRLDVESSADDRFYLEVLSEDNAVQLDIANLLAIRDGDYVVVGSDGDDTIQVTDGIEVGLVVNGVDYVLDVSSLEQLSIAGNEGVDTLTMNLSEASQSVVIRNGSVFAPSQEVNFWGHGFERIDVDGGGGDDRVLMYDSEGDDEFSSEQAAVSMIGEGFHNTADNFETVNVRATAGNDVANLIGTEGDDRLYFEDFREVFTTEQVQIVAYDFDRTNVEGGGGNDSANLFAGDGINSAFTVNRHVSVYNAAHVISANGFSKINLHANSSADELTIKDTSYDDSLYRRVGSTFMRGGFYSAFTRGFGHVEATSEAGNDSVYFYDSTGDDVATLNSENATFSTGSETTTASGFAKYSAFSDNGGADVAYLNGTLGDDVVFSNVWSTTLTGADGVVSRVARFGDVFVDTLSGNDTFFASGGATSESFVANRDSIQFNSEMQHVGVLNVSHAKFDGNGGSDRVTLSGFQELDLLSALGDKATAYLNDRSIVVEDIAILEAAVGTGESSYHDIEAVDFLYTLEGDWQEE